MSEPFVFEGEIRFRGEYEAEVDDSDGLIQNLMELIYRHFELEWPKEKGRFRVTVEKLGDGS